MPTTEYYDLPREKRWIDDGSPSVIGGRSTDVEQIGFSLERMIKDRYAVNGVPPQIQQALADLHTILDRAGEQIQGVIALVTEDVSTE